MYTGRGCLDQLSIELEERSDHAGGKESSPTHWRGCILFKTAGLPLAVTAASKGFVYLHEPVFPFCFARRALVSLRSVNIALLSFYRFSQTLPRYPVFFPILPIAFE